MDEGGAPGATKERNRTANRVLAAVDVIAGAGVMEFAKDAGVRAEVEALVVGREGKGRGRKKGAAGGDGDGVEGAEVKKGSK